MTRPSDTVNHRGRTATRRPGDDAYTWDDDPMDCPTCGEAHARDNGRPTCIGHNRAGHHCHNGPLPGQKVCGSHGGKTPRALAAAARRLQDEAARDAVVTYGLAVDVSPTDALLEEVRWTAGHVQWLRARVQELETAQIVWGTTKTETEAGGKSRLTFGGWGDDDEDETGLVDIGSMPASKVVQAAAPSIWLDLYDRERRHLVAVCTAAIKAGVEERRVRLAESQGELVAGVIRAILSDLGLTVEQQALVGEVVPRHLRLLAGGAA